MSELEIPLRIKDIAIANLWDSLRVSGIDTMDCAAFAIERVLETVAPLIAANELRRQADDLHELRQAIREEDGRSIRSSAFAEGISRLRRRADELDPPAVVR